MTTRSPPGNPAQPTAQDLLFSDIPGRLSYIGVDGVPDEYVAAARKITPVEAMPAWEAGMRALYEQMAVGTWCCMTSRRSSRRPSPI